MTLLMYGSGNIGRGFIGYIFAQSEYNVVYVDINKRIIDAINYLLVNGKRRLTPREMLRLQGFPDTFEIVCSDSQTRRQAGNAVPVNVVSSVLGEVLYGVYKTQSLTDSALGERGFDMRCDVDIGTAGFGIVMQFFSV